MTAFQPESESERAPSHEPACHSRGDGHGFRWRHAGIAALVLAAAGLAFWLLPVTDWLRQAIRWVQDLGLIGPAAFVAIYALAMTLGAPATPLNIGAGLLFGVALGTTASVAGAVIGGIVSFLLGRYLLRDWVQRKIDCYPTGDELLQRCEDRPWRFLLMIRAHPLLPAPLKNYCLGTTTVRTWVFAVATLVACVPTRLVYAYLGSAGHIGLVETGEGNEGMTTAEWWLYGVGFAVALVLTLGLTWIVKRQLAKVEDDES